MAQNNITCGLARTSLQGWNYYTSCAGGSVQPGQEPCSTAIKLVVSVIELVRFAPTGTWFRAFCLLGLRKHRIILLSREACQLG